MTVNGTKYQSRLEMQIGIKDKTQDKSCTLRSISSQREALYLQGKILGLPVLDWIICQREA